MFRQGINLVARRGYKWELQRGDNQLRFACCCASLNNATFIIICPQKEKRHRRVPSILTAANCYVDVPSPKRGFSSSSSKEGEEKIEDTVKKTVISKWDKSHKYWMSNTEYTGVVVGKEATGGEYVITDGIIGPGGYVPDHYHKWEDQTFHVIDGELLEVKIGNETFEISQGDTIHCPRGVTHYIKNIGSNEAKLISYIFPGHWAEDFMAETSRQNFEGKPDFKYIEEKFGVVYV